MKSFDDLFNEFFKRKNANPIHDELKRIIEAMTNFKKIDNIEDNLGDELGEPSEVEELIEDGLLFKKLTWNTSHGKFVKIVVSDVQPSDEPAKELNLEEQLQMAVDSEDYDLAIKLRDQIKAKKKKLKKVAK